MDVRPLLTLEDVGNTLVEPNATSMDILAAITSIALKKYNTPKSIDKSFTLHQQITSTEIHVSCSLPFKKLQKDDKVNDGTFKLSKNYDDRVCDTNNSWTTAMKSKRKVRCEDEDVRRPTKKVTRGDDIYAIPVGQDNLPNELRTLIIDTKKGTDLKLVIQKKLTKSDVKQHQNRFMMPLRQIRNKFLEDHEEELLKQREGEDLKPLVVNIIEPSDILRESSINLKRWQMDKSKTGGKPSIIYVLNKTWYTLLTNNNIGIGDTVQLWAFRVEKKLNFALVKVAE